MIYDQDDVSQDFVCSGRRSIVILAEDFYDQEELANTLLPTGAQVACASTVSDATAHLYHHRVDLLLLKVNQGLKDLTDLHQISKVSPFLPVLLVSKHLSQRQLAFLEPPCELHPAPNESNFLSQLQAQLAVALLHERLESTEKYHAILFCLRSSGYQCRLLPNPSLRQTQPREGPDVYSFL